MNNNCLTHFGLFSLLVTWTFTCIANPLTADGLESEAQRLAQVRRLVKAELNPRPADSNDKYRQPGTTAPTCSVMLQDLIAGKFKAIEPVQIRRQYDPTVFEQTQNSKKVQELRGFPKANTEKLRFCAGPEQEKKIQGVEDRFFLGFDFLSGLPPYRIYRLPRSVNPYQDSHFLYWSVYDKEIGKGSPYVWVNLDTCKPVLGPLGNSFGTPSGNGTTGIGAESIALYGGKFTYLVAKAGSGFSLQHFEPAGVRVLGDPASSTRCAWMTYPEKLFTK